MKIIAAQCIAALLALATGAHALAQADEPCFALTIEEFRIHHDASEDALQVDANGRVHVPGADGAGRIDDCGRMYGAQGTQVATVTEDMIVAHPGTEPLVGIRADGTLDNGSGTLLTWAEDGQLLEGSEPTGFRIEPADSAAKKAASALLFLYLMIPEVTAAEAE